jgi:hypothetical protein
VKRYHVHRVRRTTSRRIRLLWDRLVDLGFRKFTLQWEPWGPALEMCGCSGGYMLVELSNHEITPLGLSLDEALTGADRHAAYVSAFFTDRLAGAA